MRPRPMTAENPRGCAARRLRGRCFNEAAADDRGKPAPVGVVASFSIGASMRPRPMTAENPSSQARRSASATPLQ